MGGMEEVEQVAGVRAQVGTPLNGNLGLTYMQASGDPLLSAYNKANLMGADLKFEAGSLAVGAEWAETETTSDVGAPDSDVNNTALDANVSTNIGNVGIKAGWKSIGHNFAAPGSWDRIGLWLNPTNIEGMYGGLNFDIASNLNLTLGAEIMSGKDDNILLPNEINETGDDIKYYTAGLKWGFSAASTLDLGLQWVKWEPVGFEPTDEKYITIGLSHQFGSNVNARVAYQIVDFDTGLASGHTYSAVDNKGNLAVAQVSVKF
jgi:predicted porin